MPSFFEQIKKQLKEPSMGNNHHVERPYSLLSKLSAEFLGDLLFVFIGSLCTLKSNNFNVITHAGFAHGFTIFVLISSLGHISGGHFNPAVTLAVALSGRLRPLLVIPYWAAQLAGGFIGALLVRAVTNLTEYNSIMGGATLPAPADDWHQGLIVEVILTTLLCITVLMCAVDTDNNVLAPLAIGMAVTLDIFGAGSISGASMNPARSLGPGLAASLFTTVNDPSMIWTYHYIYWAGPLLGATIAAFLYRAVLSRSEIRILP